MNDTFASIKVIRLNSFLCQLLQSYVVTNICHQHKKIQGQNPSNTYPSVSFDSRDDFNARGNNLQTSIRRESTPGLFSCLFICFCANFDFIKISKIILRNEWLDGRASRFQFDDVINAVNDDVTITCNWCHGKYQFWRANTGWSIRAADKPTDTISTTDGNFAGVQLSNTTNWSKFSQ